MCGCLLHVQTGDLAHNPGMCSDGKQATFWFTAPPTQPTEPHQPGLCANLEKGWG